MNFFLFRPNVNFLVRNKPGENFVDARNGFFEMLNNFLLSEGILKIYKSIIKKTYAAQVAKRRLKDRDQFFQKL